MELKRSDLEIAVKRDILSQDQAESLWLLLKEKNRDVPSFQMTHILYYFGGMIAIGAMSLFMTLGWDAFGGFGLLAICIVYAILLIMCTQWLLKHRLTIPAGILATLALVLVPLAVFGLQSGLGYWDSYTHYRDYHSYIDGRWLMMELSTIVVGVLMVRYYRLPFLLMPVAVTLWYMSMDLAPILAQLLDSDSYGDYWELKKSVSLWFGLAVIVVAFVVDIKNRSSKDFAFWLYFAGVLAFWGALSSMDSNSELGKFLYCCINVIMILVGAILSRKVFVVFGGLGVAFYLGYLSYSVFKDSLLFPFVLTLIGLLIVGLGIYWQRHEKQINKALQQCLPESLRILIAEKS